MAEIEIQEPQGKPKRPNDFTDDIFDMICERMACGEGLRKICDDPEMPSRQTFLRWMEKDTGRQAKYQQAREALMDWYGEEILDIAWDSSKDTIPATKNKPARCDNEWVARSRLKVDTLKFLMSKLHPKRYGDKLEPAPLANEPQHLQVSWIERRIIRPLPLDANGNHDPDKRDLLNRIADLEEQIEQMGGKPVQPQLKQITFDPGPLPSRIDPEVLARFLRMIKDNVPRADQRAPETVLDEVLSECEAALKARYGSDEAA